MSRALMALTRVLRLWHYSAGESILLIFVQVYENWWHVHLMEMTGQRD